MSLNWELSPQNCFNCLSLFMDHLLTLKPSTEYEGKSSCSSSHLSPSLPPSLSLSPSLSPSPPLSLLSPLSLFIPELMESALGSFFASGLSQSILNEYRAPVHLLARRFFFQLLRSSRFQKAFSLAVELSSRDLFMVKKNLKRKRGGIKKRAKEIYSFLSFFKELHHTAQLHNETTLAELSLKKAEILSNRGIPAMN